MASQSLGEAKSSIGSARMSVSCLAVKALIPREEGEVLLVRRAPHAKAANPLKYGPPGGAVESGETLIEALTREVAEETKLTVSIAGIVGIREWSASHKDAHYVGVFFACEPIGRRAVVSLNHENCEFVWATSRQLHSLDLTESSRSMVEQFLGRRLPPVIPYHMPFRFEVARRT
jgi:8-oxo-dGTP diphosphatase